MADQEELEPGQDRLQLSKVIGEKLTESIQNMDILSTLQKMVAMEPGDEESLGIREKLKGVLDQFRDMSPEEKAKFAAKIKEGLASKLSTRLKDNAMLAGVEDAIKSAVMTKLYMVAAFVLIVIFLLGAQSGIKGLLMKLSLKQEYLPQDFYYKPFIVSTQAQFFSDYYEYVRKIVFFGYKLYKSIKEKEIKREEKRKAKQMKKKK